MKQFKEAKEFITTRAKELQACSSEYKKALRADNFDELIGVVRCNASWVRQNELLTDETSIKYFNVSLSNLLNLGHSNSGNWNSGHCNSGDRNSGHSNSGHSNSGSLNSGYSNSGNWNSGDSNSGYSNSGHRNSGDRNSGDRNSGDRNSGHSNSGNLNSGYSNSGNWNSGDWNSGNRNSGNGNSGDWNSGFFNTNTPKTIDVFNKPCDREVWKNANKPHFIDNIKLNKWVLFSNMTDEEKKNNKEAYVCDGYLKTIGYKEAWKIAYESAIKEDIELLKKLPNFDADVFEEITGIKVK